MLPGEHEIRQLIRGCPSQMLSRMVEILWFTGMCVEEAASLEWRQIHVGRRAIQLGKTKTDSPRAVPLSTDAVGTISGTPRFLRCQWVFWYGEGERYKSLTQNELSDFSRLWFVVVANDDGATDALD